MAWAVEKKGKGGSPIVLGRVVAKGLIGKFTSWGGLLKRRLGARVWIRSVIEGGPASFPGKNDEGGEES